MKTMIVILMFAVFPVLTHEANARESYAHDETSADSERSPEAMERTDFMSFFVDFMRDPNRQKDSIRYPVSVTGNIIEDRNQWTHLPFFSMSEYMPILYFDHKDEFDGEVFNPDIVMSIINFENQSYQDVSFTAYNTGWLLTKVESGAIGNHYDRHFLQFLTDFSKAPDTQKSAIRFPLPLKTFDDEYELTERTVTESEWVHRNLAETAENLVVLDIYDRNTPVRRVYFRGVGCGISESYYFIRTNEIWKLTRIESLSM